MLGAGLVGGLTAHFLAPTPAEAKSGASEALSPALDDVDLGPLNVQLAALTRRLDMLEAGDSLGTRRPAGDAALFLPPEQLQEAVAAAIEGKVGSAGSMQSMVASTLDQIRMQEEAQKQIERDQQRQDALQRRIDRLTEDLGLYPDQASKMLTILSNEDTQRNDMREAMRTGGADFANLRDDMNTLRDTTKNAVAEVLTAEQLEKYNASNNGGFGGGGGRRGGGFGGPAGGPTGGGN